MIEKIRDRKKRRKMRFHDREDAGEREKKKRNCVFLSLKFEMNSEYVRTQEIFVHFPPWSPKFENEPE